MFEVAITPKLKDSYPNGPYTVYGMNDEKFLLWDKKDKKWFWIYHNFTYPIKSNDY